MVRELRACCPAQTPLPVTVSVAVKDPDAVEGVKTYVAGLVPVPDHEPLPTPPLQAKLPNVPEAVVPVMVMAALLHCE